MVVLVVVVFGCSVMVLNGVLMLVGLLVRFVLVFGGCNEVVCVWFYFV